MEVKTQVELLKEIIQATANERPTFFEIKGAGAGDKDSNAFMAEVRRRALNLFGVDYAEKKICGDSAHAVDFYFQEDATIVEIALTLRNPNTEFEKDILKALMAQEENYPVKKLVFISKPGAVKACNRPGRRAMCRWALSNHNLTIEIVEIENIHLSRNSL